MIEDNRKCATAVNIAQVNSCRSHVDIIESWEKLAINLIEDSNDELYVNMVNTF